MKEAARIALRLPTSFTLLVALLTPVAAEPVIAPVELERVDAESGRLVIAADAALPYQTRLILSGPSTPLGWFEQLEDRPKEYGTRRALSWNASDELRAWVVPADLVARLRPQWPAHAPLRAEIDSVGPGGRTIWLAAGGNQGVRVGQMWWLRIDGGQPVARFDVRCVERDVSFCRVVPFVDDPRLAAGQLAEAWPSPGEAQRGEARSGVTYVEPLGAAQLVWAPMPPDADASPEPSLDFYRDGRFVGHALVERRDDRFWFARSLPEAGLIEIGDDVRVRTRAIIARREFVARIFQLTPEGALLNAGEAERIGVDDGGTAYRGGAVLGAVRCRKVQPSFSIVVPAEQPATFALEAGDEVRFGPPPLPARVVGAIERIAARTLFVAQGVGESSLPLNQPLGIQHNRRPIGVALLFSEQNGRAFGFVIEGTLIAPLTAGAELTLDAASLP